MTLFRALRAQYRRAPDDPPHVPGPWPWLGVAMAYGKDAGAFLAELKRAHGDVFSVFLAGDRVTFVTNPHDYPTVLAEKDLAFAPIAHDISARAFGHAAEDIEALERFDIHQRDLHQLRGDPLAVMTASVQRLLHDILLDRPTPGAVGLYDWVCRVIFEATGRSVFGEGFQSDVDLDAFLRLDAQFPFLVAGIPANWLGIGRLREALGRVMAIERTRAAAVTVERFRLFRAESRPEVLGPFQLAFLWATQANTMPSAFWAVYLALRDARARKVITDEVRRTFAAADRDPDSGRPLLDAAALRDLVYLDSAIDEALRLTSGSLSIRVATRDVALPLDNGETLRIRAGERVGIYPWLGHHNPEIFEAPDEYRFDRFVEDGRPKRVFELNGKRLARPLMPFGGGISMCPGRHFARNEIKIFAAVLLDTFDIALEPGPIPPFVEGRAGLGIFAPAHDVRATLSRP